jgi:SAM-dependent methyltransferase
MDAKGHWERTYSRRSPSEQSWHQDSPTLSLELIERSAIGRDARILDVGGGSSMLVDRLLDRRYRDVSVLDLSEAALQHARDRLGPAGDHVRWIVGDVTTFRAESPIDLWHDRAVLHFLTAERDRAAYHAVLDRSLTANGQAVIATFATDGPERCSGLPVVRYGEESMRAFLGPGFRLLESVIETHRTPAGVDQRFVYFRAGRIPGGIGAF